MSHPKIGGAPRESSEQQALDLLSSFYAEWNAPLRSEDHVDGSRLVDWFAERMDRIEDVVQGSSSLPLALRLVMVAQTDGQSAELEGCAILTRSGRFQKGLKMDSPNVGLFPTEDAAIAAAHAARNRKPGAKLLLIHLDMKVLPFSSTLEDQFRVETQVNLRTVDVHANMHACNAIAAQ